MKKPTLEEIQNELRRRKLIRFVEDSLKGYEAGWVHHKICDKLEQFLQDIIDKKSPRLILSMPPRHGKSFIATERFPCWGLGKYPHMEFVCASYGASLSEEFSKVARNICADEYFKGVFPNFSFGSRVNVKKWDTDQRGSYKAVGVGGGVTGSGAHALIIDDPLKDRAEAMSRLQRENVWNWYVSTAYTRLAPGGGILLIMTRWHDDDLAGRLIKAMNEGADKWDVLEFPAIAVVDDENRKKGEALHPIRYGIDRLKAIEKTIGPREWTSLYQQNPRIEGGHYIKREWFNIIETNEVPDGLQYRRSWDLAIKAKISNDNTASAKGAMFKNGYFYIWNLMKFKKEWPDTKKIIIQNGKIEKIPIGIEAVAAFEIAVQEIRPLLKGICPVKGYGVTTDKLVRAIPWIDLAENGKVFLVNTGGGNWIEDFLDECETFDPIKDSAPDDQIDAVSILYEMVKNANKKVKVI